MTSRAARIFLIAFQVLFLNVIVPGHTRGIVTMSGRSSAAGVEASNAGGGCCRTHGGPRRTPSDKDRAECAICFFAARVTPPPVVDFHLTFFALLAAAPVPPPVEVITADVPLTYLGRAPPAA